MLESIPQRLFTRLSTVLLPEDIRARPSEDRRRALLVICAAWVTPVLAVCVAGVHLAFDEFDRAMLSLLGIPVGALMLWLVRKTDSSVVAANVLCGFASFILVVDPMMASTDTPVPVGLILLPFAAATIGGVKTGMLWTTVTSAFLVAWTAALPFEGQQLSLAWMTVISATALGVGSSYAEWTRKQAVDESRQHAQERLHAEKELNRTRALFEVSFENAPSILIIANLVDGKMIYVNNAFCRASGWSAEEAQGRSLTELNAWPNEEERHRLARHSIAQAGVEAVELQLRSRAGVPIWLLAGAKVLQVEGQAYLLAQGIEIGERKRTERKLAIYRAQLEEGFKEQSERLRQHERLSSVGTLTSGIAHQINNPIGGIVAAAQFALVSKDESDREQIWQEALERIVEEAQRCGRIVRNMLKFARNEPTAKWKNDFGGLVRGAAESVRTYVEERGGQLDLALTREPLPVQASPIDFEQVVVNLVRNAVESRPGGGHVSVSTQRIGGQAILEVSDNGSGFEKQGRDRAFDPFCTTRVHEGGSGLGLSIVHGIVKDHGGQVELLDSESGGALVRVGIALLDET